MRRIRRPLAPGMGVLALLLCCSPAQAAFPGANGKIATGGGDIHVLNADGSGHVDLTPGPANDDDPAWSPDGTRIAFERGQDVFVMNADGSNVTQLTTHVGDDGNPAWSPDGTKIVFDSDRHGNQEVYVMNADGSGVVRLTNNAASDGDPAWSPDGAKIAFVSDRESYDCEGEPTCVERPTWRIFTMNPDGSAVTLRVATGPHGGCVGGQDAFAPDWSPDGRYIAHEVIWTDLCLDGDIRVVDSGAGQLHTEVTDPNRGAPAGSSWSPDGTLVAFIGDSSLTVAAPNGLDKRTVGPFGGSPSWQPIPINAYARPKGASPMRLSLVPAYAQCTAPNRQHGAPLSSPSCTPPARASTTLTFGTPDVNVLTPNGIGIAVLNARADNPGTPADESDVRLRLRVTDVRRTSDLADYTGQLEARPVLRITDKNNTPHPGGPGAGTTTDIPFPFTAPCTPTAAGNIGSACESITTAQAVLPGSVTRGKHAIWELRRFDVYDAGGARFLTEGLFVP